MGTEEHLIEGKALQSIAKWLEGENENRNICIKDVTYRIHYGGCKDALPTAIFYI